MCSAARMRSVAMKRSATIPTKNGEIIAASAVVPAASPICSPEKCRVCPSHVPIVTYHAPQTKYCRNIIADSFKRTCVGIQGSILVLQTSNFRLQTSHFLSPPGLNGRFGQNRARQQIDRCLQSFV